MHENRMIARPATLLDEPFLKELHSEIRAPEFAPANLSYGQLQELLTGQYEARRMYYAHVFPEAVYNVLEANGEAIGYDVVQDGPELHLIDIAVRPKLQNRGFGTQRMRQLLEDATVAGKTVLLSVEDFNPAKRLYERLGFEPVEEFGIYQRMRWTAPIRST